MFGVDRPIPLFVEIHGHQVNFRPMVNQGHHRFLHVPDHVCEVCQLGKQHRHPFLSERNVSKGLLDIIHSDVWGPTQTTTIGGCRYFVTFIDDYSRHTWICPMKSKSEVFSHFLKLNNRVENETNHKIRCLRLMVAKNTSQSSSRTFYKRRGFAGNSLAGTHHSKTVLLSGRITQFLRWPTPCCRRRTCQRSIRQR